MGDIRGALVTLRAMVESRVRRLHADLQAPDRWPMVFANKAPDFDTLADRLITRAIRFWEILPEGSPSPTGYAGYRVLCGYPFLFFIFTKGGFNHDVVQDATPALVNHFFTYTHPRLPSYRQGDPLMIFLDRGVLEDMHPYLIENGFDPFPDFPTIDNDKLAAYGLWPETYEAYYGESAEDGSADAYFGEDYVPTGEYEGEGETE